MPPTTTAPSSRVSRGAVPNAAVGQRRLSRIDPGTTRTATVSPPRWLAVRAGLAVGVWREPGSALIGFLGGVEARWGRFTAGAQAELTGVVCCRLDDVRFTGDALEAAFLIEARVRLVRWGPVDVAGAASAGVAYVRIEGQPDDNPSFPVGLAEQARTAWNPRARLAVGAQWALWSDGLEVGLWGGAQLRADRLVVDLPTRDGTAPSVDPGLVTPWSALTISYPIF